MKSSYSRILILFILINFGLCFTKDISAKIDFGPVDENPITMRATIDGNRGFVQQMPRGSSFNGRRSSFRPQDRNFVRNDKFPNRGQGNTGRNNGNNRPPINYIRVLMDGGNPNPCESESCTLILVKKHLRDGSILINVYINMDESQIDTEGGEVIIIKVTPLSQGSFGNPPNEPDNSKRRCFPRVPQNRCSSGNSSPNGPNGANDNEWKGCICFGNPSNPPQFYDNPPQSNPPYPPFRRPESYPQQPEKSKGIIDDKIGYSLSKTNKSPSKA